MFVLLHHWLSNIYLFIFVQTCSYNTNYNMKNYIILIYVMNSIQHIICTHTILMRFRITFCNTWPNGVSTHTSWITCYQILPKITLASIGIFCVRIICWIDIHIINIIFYSSHSSLEIRFVGIITFVNLVIHFCCQVFQYWSKQKT